MGTVALRGLRKRYPGGPEVVRGVDLDIADGEFVTLVGPSGCGKSTLLNLIAGLEAPSAGSVAIDGVAVDDRSPGERDVAMVFQSYALYPHMDVRRNIGFPLEVARVDRATIDARVRETATRLGLEHLLARKPRELSGGQRQRAALGRALVRRPRVFLFDEPLSNLDAALRTQMRAELKKLHEELRATFVYVTHDQAEAMTLSDRVVVLHQGVVQQVDTPRAVYARPANTFVAGFFGTPRINLLPPAALAGPARDGVTAGLRPEDVAVGTGPTPPGGTPGVVFLVEPMGAETWVTVQIADVRVTARASGEFEAKSGEPAWVRPEWSRAAWFDAKTEARVA